MLQKKIGEVASRFPASVTNQQTLGEVAYSYLVICVAMREIPSLSVPLSQSYLLTIGQVKEVAERAFQQCITIAPDKVSAPYNRLARMMLLEHGMVAATEATENLLKAMYRNPSSPDGIDVLVKLLMDTQIIDDLENYRFVFKALKQLEWEALEELKSQQQRVQKIIRESLALSEEYAILGRIDHKLQSRLSHRYDVNVLIQGVVAPGVITIVRP